MLRFILTDERENVAISVPGHAQMPVKDPSSVSAPRLKAVNCLHKWLQPIPFLGPQPVQHDLAATTIKRQKQLLCSLNLGWPCNLTEQMQWNRHHTTSELRP